MIQALKNILQNRSTHVMADYYQLRLQSTNNNVEKAAILSMNALLSLNAKKCIREAIK